MLKRHPLHKLHFLILSLICPPLMTVSAGWLDFLNPKSNTSTGTTAGAATTLAALSQSDVASGLKEALSKGVNQAIANLGKEGGFLNNADVKIPMPPQLHQVETALRAMGQSKLADEFVATMNHAAEQAVPVAANVFAGAITNMTVEDAKAILTGPSDAATQYFRKTSEPQLHEQFLPIVREATAKTGVTASYKNLLQQAGPVASFLGKDASDLDGYVTKKSLDGLFKMVAAEEKRIRENPVARTTDLLKKVFGTLK
jgi:hypothetical protein